MQRGGNRGKIRGMDIPDRLSDMDSIPETISLRDSREAASVGLAASVADSLAAMVRAGDSIERFTKHLSEFSRAVEVAELECLYPQDST
jgi:hypothetical protein